MVAPLEVQICKPICDLAQKEVYLTKQNVTMTNIYVSRITFLSIGMVSSARFICAFVQTFLFLVGTVLTLGCSEQMKKSLFKNVKLGVIAAGHFGIGVVGFLFPKTTCSHILGLPHPTEYNKEEWENDKNDENVIFRRPCISRVTFAVEAVVGSVDLVKNIAISFFLFIAMVATLGMQETIKESLADRLLDTMCSAMVAGGGFIGIFFPGKISYCIVSPWAKWGDRVLSSWRPIHGLMIRQINLD